MKKSSKSKTRKASAANTSAAAKGELMSEQKPVMLLRGMSGTSAYLTAASHPGMRGAMNTNTTTATANPKKRKRGDFESFLSQN